LENIVLNFTITVSSSILDYKNWAEICSFLTDMAKFLQNSDRQLQISDLADFRCSKFQFWL